MAGFHPTLHPFFVRSLRIALCVPLGLVAGVAGCSDIAGPGPDGFADPPTSSTSDGTQAPGGGGSAGTDGTTGGGSSGGGDPGDTGGTGGPPPPDDDGIDTSGGSTGGDTCDDQTPVELFISPDDSNSMSSPIQVREAVLNGSKNLSSIPIRAFEFFNYYSFPYLAAMPGTVSLETALFQSPTDPAGEYLLQIGISSEVVANTARPPVNVTMVLDTSSSMQGDPIERLKDVARAIAASLRLQDKVSIVTWNTNQVPILAGFQVTGPNDPTLVSKIEALDASGGTDLHAGLEAGYALANQVWEVGRINRLVLVSDGGANVGVTETQVIADNAALNNDDGIYLVGVGVGNPNTYDDTMMDRVTIAGRGASVFIANEEEAWKTFNQRFVNTMMVAARNMQIRLDLPPGFEIVETSAESLNPNPNPADIDPQHLAPNDSMVLHQRIRTCAPGTVDDTSELTVNVKYEHPVSYSMQEVSSTVTFNDLLSATDPLLHKGMAISAYTSALMAYKRADTLAEKDFVVRSALEKIDAAGEFLPQDTDLAEIRLILQAL